jgi:hypothetical protein
MLQASKVFVDQLTISDLAKDLVAGLLGSLAAVALWQILNFVRAVFLIQQGKATGFGFRVRALNSKPNYFLAALGFFVGCLWFYYHVALN